MTCCIGKARIYYKEPIGFQLKYKAPGGNWVTVTAQEPLTSICTVVDLNLPVYPPGDYGIYFDVTQTNIQNTGAITNITYTENSRVSVSGTIWFPSTHRLELYERQHTMEVNNTFPKQYFTVTQTAMKLVNEVGNIVLGYSGQTNQYGYTNYSDLSWWMIGRNNERLDPDPTYEFKVIGENTGNVYAFLAGLEECPAVENLGCVMGEEKSFDVEMSTPYDLIWLPNCIKTEKIPPDFKRLAIKKIWELPIPSNLTLKKVYEKDLKILPIIDGCPDPQVRVVCCPDGECEPEKCPPDTDCSLDCGNFICCYKNGKAIRRVRK